MAHTFDTKLRFTGATGPLASNYTCAVGVTVLVVSVVTAGSTNRAGGNPTFNGIGMLQADQLRKYTTAPETSCELFYMLNPPTGAAHSISVPNTGTRTLYVVALSYIAQNGYTSVLDEQNGGTGATLNPSVSVTTTVNGDVIVGVMGHGLTSIPTGRSGIILYETDNGQHTDNAQYQLQSTYGTWATSWTVAADDWCICVAAFKESPIISGRKLSYNSLGFGGISDGVKPSFKCPNCRWVWQGIKQNASYINELVHFQCPNCYQHIALFVRTNASIVIIQKSDEEGAGGIV